MVLYTKDYGISMGVLSSFFHSPPTSSTRLLFFDSRLLRPRGRPELGAGGATSSSSSLEPAAYSCFIIGRLRSGILSFITGRLCSCRLICVIGSVTAFTSGPSSICGKGVTKTRSRSRSRSRSCGLKPGAGVGAGVAA